MALLDMFDGMNIFGARPSSALTDAEQEKLKNQSLLSGLLGAGATYLAQPKNQNIGLGAILGKSYLGGMQQSQGTYDTALKSKIDALGITKTQKQIEMEGMTDPQKLLYAKNRLDSTSPTYTEDLAVINSALKKAIDTPEQYTGGQKLLAQYNSLKPDSPTYAADKAYLEKLMQMELQSKGTNVITNVSTQTPFKEEIQKKTADKLITNYENLQNAPATIDALRRAKALAENNPIIGSLGDKKLATIQFFNNTFGTKVDPKAVKDTTELKSVLFSSVMENLKKMDATPSESQQAQMKEAFGNITTDPAALQQVLNFWESQTLNKVNQHNARVDSLKPDLKSNLPYDIKINIPASSTSGNQPATIIKYDAKGRRIN